VKLVGPALGNDVDYGAACAPVLCRVVSAKHRHFLEAIAECRLKLLAGDRVVIVVCAVNQLVVRARSQPVDVELRPLDKSTCEDSGVGDARKRKDKIHGVEPGDGQVNNLARLEGARTSAILLLQNDS